ncbi:MAG: phytanoyl-CoA dioxygenase family protein [Planctomycetota bacterium]|nr:phytanoyl-CoA dioxygenase family protein [Planctomycetota bacterium]
MGGRGRCATDRRCSLFKLTQELAQQFQRDGYIVVPGLFDTEEMDALLKTAKADRQLEQSAYGRKDASGAVSKLALWNEPGDDLYGTIARCERIVNTMETLLGDEVYHWHSKMMLKEPLVGGAWEWHQDYGYWYNMGCLFPDMASCLISVDRASKENGCLQVLKGSHKIGRINHLASGEQAGADMERVEQAMQRFELVHCETAPGTGIFFHGNTLHRSDQNRSPNSRWSLICTYNTKHNSPYKPSRHAAYAPLKRVPDSAVKEWIGRQGQLVGA